MRDIEVWFGTGGGYLAGPIEATCVEELPNGEVRFFITDRGWDDPVEFTYPRLRPDFFVRYDAYAWCPKGEGPKDSPRASKW
jgi:hypothetical protein